ncbi:FtsX-like permease family protein [Treponema pectinovorum]|uniref:FtsX-like permease family protein n=2 Tax=Treponema pectinovorum TaxID=164 RepID=UPI0011F189BE|nr:FtsX-like permease family protein [Treponema pectinovorum]
MKTEASILYAYRMLFPQKNKMSNARRSLFGAFLCIALSLIPLVMVMTVSNGMIEGMTSRIISLSTSHLCAILNFQTLEEDFSLKTLQEFSKNVKDLDGVKNVYPEIQSVGLASGENGRTGASIRCVENDIFSKNPAFSQLFELVESTEEIKAAKDIVLEEGKNAVIGKKIAQILSIHAGDSIRLITTVKLASGKIIPKITKFKVSAIVSSGYQELDALWVFVPLKTGFSILQLSSSEIMLGIETLNPFSYELDKTLASVENLMPPFTRVYKWNELNSSQYENFSSTQIMLLFIMLLIVLVASVNISSALVMLVMERRKEIAILKSLGATPSGISFSFLITGMVTGALGVFVGIPLGLLCAVNFARILSIIEKTLTFFKKLLFIISTGDASFVEPLHILDPAFYLQNIPLSIPFFQLVVVGSGTLLLSIFVSSFPAFKAGMEKPIENLKKL